MAEVAQVGPGTHRAKLFVQFAICEDQGRFVVVESAGNNIALPFLSPQDVNVQARLKYRP